MSETTKANKQRLRKKTITLLKKQRQKSILEKSKSICSKISRLQQFKKAKAIMLYFPKSEEVDTGFLVEKIHWSKTICLPKMIGGNLAAVKIGKNTRFKTQKYDVIEPVGPTFDLKKINLVVCPLVGFDGEKNRLGRGKAFFDKFIRKARKASPKIVFVGAGFELQRVKKIPAEKHDEKTDFVVTEKKVY
ncbi:5-formyltetrahydrofolate cyclo-ligase [Candidatus Micrarchaeota archaeon]|nr:5-formyltetrahydrofolate cyclo-ligase [Candidatus Micrarchaeota archaeon]